MINLPVTSKRIINKSAIAAALALIAMAILAPIAHFGILPSLVSDDALVTAGNITGNSALFIVAIACLTLVALLDFVVAIALYKFFAPAKLKLNFYMALARIVYGIIFLFAIGFLASALTLQVGSSDIAERINGFNTVWDVALILFAIHLILLAILFWKVRFTPTWLSPLLLIAGLGYGIDSVGKLSTVSYTVELAAVAFVGEVILIFWLLIRGRKV